MSLEEYMRKNNLSVVEFSKSIGIHFNTIYSIMNGNRKPSYKMARKIEEATNGEVKTEDLIKIDPKIPQQLYNFCPTCGKPTKEK